MDSFWMNNKARKNPNDLWNNKIEKYPSRRLVGTALLFLPNKKHMQSKPSMNVSLLAQPTKPNPNSWYFKPTKSDKKLNWNQAKKKYPTLSPRRDYDADFFRNSKDCKPFDHNKDGILAAIAGAISGAVSGGGIKKGWSEGMAKPGVYKQYVAQQFAKTRMTPVEKLKEKYALKEIQDRIKYEALPKQKTVQVMTPIPGAEDGMDVREYPVVHAKSIIGVVKTQYEPKQTTNSALDAIDKQTEAYEKLEEMKEAKRQLTPVQQEAFRQKQMNIERKMQKKYEDIEQIQARKRISVPYRLVGQVLNVPVTQAIRQSGIGKVETIKGGKGGEAKGAVGRPKGTYDNRYSAYGGVYGYRKWVSQQKAVRRMAEEQERLMLQAQEKIQMAQQAQEYQQMQQQQYQPQPQQQVQQQMQYEQPQQEQPRTDVKKPFAYLFEKKQQMPQQMPQRYQTYPQQQMPQQMPRMQQKQPLSEYYEDYNSFTGEKVMKKRLPTERFMK